MSNNKRKFVSNEQLNATNKIAKINHNEVKTEVKTEYNEFFFCRDIGHIIIEYIGCNITPSTFGSASYFYENFTGQINPLTTQGNYFMSSNNKMCNRIINDADYLTNYLLTARECKSTNNSDWYKDLVYVEIHDNIDTYDNDSLTGTLCKYNGKFFGIVDLYMKKRFDFSANYFGILNEVNNVEHDIEYKTMNLLHIAEYNDQISVNVITKGIDQSLRSPGISLKHKDIGGVLQSFSITSNDEVYIHLIDTNRLKTSDPVCTKRHTLGYFNNIIDFGVYGKCREHRKVNIYTVVYSEPVIISKQSDYVILPMTQFNPFFTVIFLSRGIHKLTTCVPYGEHLKYIGDIPLLNNVDGITKFMYLKKEQCIKRF
jgi:hypothetical protein